MVNAFVFMSAVMMLTLAAMLPTEASAAAINTSRGVSANARKARAAVPQPSPTHCGRWFLETDFLGNHIFCSVNGGHACTAESTCVDDFCCRRDPPPTRRPLPQSTSPPQTATNTPSRDGGNGGVLPRTCGQQFIDHTGSRVFCGLGGHACPLETTCIDGYCCEDSTVAYPTCSNGGAIVFDHTNSAIFCGRRGHACPLDSLCVDDFCCTEGVAAPATTSAAATTSLSPTTAPATDADTTATAAPPSTTTTATDAPTTSTATTTTTEPSTTTTTAAPPASLSAAPPSVSTTSTTTTVVVPSSSSAGAIRGGIDDVPTTAAGALVVSLRFPDIDFAAVFGEADSPLAIDFASAFVDMVVGDGIVKPRDVLGIATEPTSSGDGAVVVTVCANDDCYTALQSHVSDTIICVPLNSADMIFCTSGAHRALGVGNSGDLNTDPTDNAAASSGTAGVIVAVIAVLLVCFVVIALVVRKRRNEQKAAATSSTKTATLSTMGTNSPSSSAKSFSGADTQGSYSLNSSSFYADSTESMHEGRQSYSNGSEDSDNADDDEYEYDDARPGVVLTSIKHTKTGTTPVPAVVPLPPVSDSLSSATIASSATSLQPEDCDVEPTSQQPPSDQESTATSSSGRYDGDFGSMASTLSSFAPPSGFFSRQGSEAVRNSATASKIKNRQQTPANMLGSTGDAAVTLRSKATPLAAPPRARGLRPASGLLSMEQTPAVRRNDSEPRSTATLATHSRPFDQLMQESKRRKSDARTVAGKAATLVARAAPAGTHTATRSSKQPFAFVLMNSGDNGDGRGEVLGDFYSDHSALSTGQSTAGDRLRILDSLAQSNYFAGLGISDLYSADGSSYLPLNEGKHSKGGAHQSRRAPSHLKSSAVGRYDNCGTPNDPRFGTPQSSVRVDGNKPLDFSSDAAQVSRARMGSAVSTDSRNLYSNSYYFSAPPVGSQKGDHRYDFATASSCAPLQDDLASQYPPASALSASHRMQRESSVHAYDVVGSGPMLSPIRELDEEKDKRSTGKTSIATATTDRKQQLMVADRRLMMTKQDRRYDVADSASELSLL